MVAPNGLSRSGVTTSLLLKDFLVLKVVLVTIPSGETPKIIGRKNCNAQVLLAVLHRVILILTCQFHLGNGAVFVIKC